MVKDNARRERDLPKPKTNNKPQTINRKIVNRKGTLSQGNEMAPQENQTVRRS